MQKITIKIKITIKPKNTDMNGWNGRTAH